MAEETNTNQNQTPPMQGPGSGSADVKGMVAQLEALLDEYMVAKAPFALPMNAKELIVKIAPYLVLIFAILTLPVVIAALGLTAVMSPFMMMGGYYGLGHGGFGVLGLLAGIVSLVALVIELMAVKGLFNRTHKAWRLVFYASLVALIANLLSFNLIGGLIGAIIGWYFLFQVKELYKN